VGPASRGRRRAAAGPGGAVRAGRARGPPGRRRAARGPPCWPSSWASTCGCRPAPSRWSSTSTPSTCWPRHRRPPRSPGSSPAAPGR
jgi:hypothetical protein